MRTTIFSLAALLVLAVVLQAEVPQLMNYQGRLTDATGNPLEGTYSLTIRLYDVPSGGSAIWTETHPAVSVQKGLFTLVLGSISSLSPTIFADSVRYIGVQIGTDPELLPRSRLTSVAYAMNSASSGTTGQWGESSGNVYRTSGNVGVGTATPAAALDIQGGPGRVALSVNGNDPMPMLNVDTDGDFKINPHSGIGKSFKVGAYTSDGVRRDIIAISNEFSHPSIPDLELQPEGGNVGIGTSAPAAALDIQGGPGRVALSVSGADPTPMLNADVGGDFTINPHSGTGKGFRIGAYTTDGVRRDIIAVRNEFSHPSIPDLELQPEGGKVGIGTTTPEATLDVFARGDGVQLLKLNTERPWVFMQRGTESDTRLTLEATSGSKNFEVRSYDGFPVGIFRTVAGGGYFMSGASTYLMGDVGIGTTAPIAKLHVIGDLCVTGQKNAIVPTSHGMTKVYSEESAEVWFTDYGRTSLTGGRVHIDLDPLFLETVTITSDEPMMVFLQEESESNGLIVKPGLTGFDVIEKSSGTSNATFSYRIVAKRKGLEAARLESVQTVDKGGEQE